MDKLVRRGHAFWYALIVLVITLGIFIFAVIGYIARSNHQQDERWCDLLISLDQPLTISPSSPQYARALIIHNKIHKLRIELDCK